MDNSRKQIIIHEITYWKQSKLLPDHYCDFLLALYSEGEYKEEAPKKQVFSSKELFTYIWLFVSIAFIPITILVNYFTKWPLQMQMGLAIAFIVMTMTAAIIGKRNKYFFHVSIITTVLLIFLLCVGIAVTLFPTNNYVLASVVLGNCLAWILFGIRLKVLYFAFSGAVGFVVVFLLMFM
ncbi:hypothetical protein EJF36_13860 [Bacillus sp. HMF5848]|uniref:hypothetical protein n=1 Tax=Bacillus sp. HMF5848 TaxID=2495421 RepID=UPI000F7982FD|nr:hypothetical protein [Bacillus sp. HMF5848]RSK27875.1 hypothetical protein EJF36_13860 [Bacillus sp. HMF5848]